MAKFTAPQDISTMASNAGVESFYHQPVLLAEVMEWLQPAAGFLMVDATVGGGGHAAAMAHAIQPGGRLIGLDRDAEALRAAGMRLRRFGEAATLVHSRFDRVERVLDNLGIAGIDGMLMDLGASSKQLDDPGRGLSFLRPGPLDMRMDQSEGKTARELVNGMSEAELTDIFYRYGEERWSKRIAQRIVEARRRSSIEMTSQLAEIVAGSIPRAAWPRGIHPATRVFQALRIAVNEELAQIEPAIRQGVKKLNIGRRMAVISFHSLEDRLVKNTFALLAGRCTCPPGLPLCQCGAAATVRVLTRKPVMAGVDEVVENQRSRSAKMRVIERL